MDLTDLMLGFTLGVLGTSGSKVYHSKISIQIVATSAWLSPAFFDMAGWLQEMPSKALPIEETYSLG